MSKDTSNLFYFPEQLSSPCSTILNRDDERIIARRACEIRRLFKVNVPVEEHTLAGVNVD